MTARKSALVCARCGLPVRDWHFGWKHSGGGNSKPSCGKPPIPTARRGY